MKNTNSTTNSNETQIINPKTLLKQAGKTVKVNQKILDSIIAIFEEMEKSELCQESIDSVSEEIKIVEAYLGCTQIQAILFSCIFGIQHRSGVPVNFEMISNHLGQSLLYVLKYMKELNVLIKKDLLNQADDENNTGSIYAVDKNVINCIIEGVSLKNKNSDYDTLTVFFKLHDILQDAVGSRVVRSDYVPSIIGVEKSFRKNEVIKNVTATYPDNIEARIFIYSLCDRVINGTDYQDGDENGSGFSYKIFPIYKWNEMKRELDDNTFCVLKDEYAGSKFIIHETGFGRRHEIFTVYSLTQKGIEKFFGSESINYTAEESIYSGLEKVKQFLLAFSKNFETRRNPPLKFRMLTGVERQFSDLSFVKKLKKIVPDATNRYVLYECCSNFVNLNSSSNLTDVLQSLFGTEKMFFNKVHEYKDEKSFLIKEGFVYLDKAENIKQAELDLTDRTLELIYGKDADIFINSNSDQNVIVPEKLNEKTLFYPDEIVSQIDMLKKSLENKNLVEMQKRLEAKKLPKGVAVLLYGAPGTGKTESVYQIAKATNRKIYHVDISQTKSMWFGESEKLIKRIFVNYKNLCKTCALHNQNVPILLFNEADAIISKRKNVSMANTAQTENAIQNIILEQMETLDGIMIATTNLCENMDSAFERRFLFKIKFDRPGVKERSQIWKDKLPLLSDEEAEQIADRYDFSGGEIENIVRKCEIDEVITGIQPEFEKIEELCKNERLASEEKCRVGFCL